MKCVGLGDVADLLTSDSSVGVMSTDTLFGLAARVDDAAAIKRLYKLKNRDQKPGTVISGSLQHLLGLGLDEAQLQRAAEFWPNPVSIIVDASSELEYLHQGVGSLAVRVPAIRELRELLLKTGPLMTSSSNLPGMRPATSAIEAYGYFGDRVDFYCDEVIGSGSASAVIRIVGSDITIMRPPDSDDRHYYSGIALRKLFSEPLV